MKKIIKITLLLFIVAGLSSCLKDNAIISPDAPGSVRNVVEFKNPARPASGLANSQPYYVFSYEIAPIVQMVIPINFAGADVAPNDIKVTIALDQVALDSANSQQKTSLGIMPESFYSVPSWEVTIKKGQRIANLVFDIKVDQFVLAAYALPLKIVSVVGTKAPISGNYGSIVASVGLKNALDGIYNYKSASDQSLNAGADQDGAKLVTVGANTVSTNLVNTYSNITIYSFDPVTHSVTVENSGGIGDAITDPSSNYDPVTRTIYIKWKTSNRKFEETYTYIGPRP